MRLEALRLKVQQLLVPTSPISMRPMLSVPPCGQRRVKEILRLLHLHLIIQVQKTPI
jgi:hypothetical protein